jgi:hypothetical protein
MMVIDAPICESVDESSGDTFPAEVQLVISALEAGGAEPGIERRALPRMQYRVKAYLRLFSDPTGSAPWLLYTRDVGERGVGFVTEHRLPLGYGGIVELTAPDGTPLAIQGTVNRCRETAPGWFEGALHFNRNQHLLAPPLTPDDMDGAE